MSERAYMSEKASKGGVQLNSTPVSRAEGVLKRLLV